MKYNSPEVNEDGWTDWFTVGPKWNMRCCDCKLVHNFEFLVSIKGKQATIHTRSKRDVRATAASRRKK